MNGKRFKRTMVMALFASSALGFVACDDDDDNNGITQPTSSSFVRIGHLSPDAPDVDVWVDGSIVLEDVPYSAFSGYLELDAGSHRVQVSPANSTEPIVIDATVDLMADTYYTVAATGLLADIGPAVFMDDPVTDSANAKVRFVHASPDAPAVDITLSDGTVLFPNIAFNEASTVLSTPGANYDLQVRVAGTETVALNFADVGLQDGMNYTVFAKGLLADNSLSAIVTLDDAENGSTTVPLMPASAGLRVLHLSPDAPNVDVYLNGAMVSGLENVPFQGISPYLTIPAATHNVQIFATGTSSNPVIDEMLSLGSNNWYTVAATGFVADIGTAVLMDDTMPDNSNAKIRFVHASPDAPAVDITLNDGTVLFGDVSFNEASSFLSTPGMDYDLQVRVAGTETVALSFADVALSNNSIYTVYANGLLSDGSLSAMVSIDDANDGSASLLLSPAMASLRLTHLSPDAPAVDIYLNGAMVEGLANVPFQALSPYLSVGAATHNVQIFASGTTSNPVIDATLTLAADMYYTVAATGLLADIMPTVLMDDTITDADNAKIRFVHASPDAPAVDITLTDGTILFPNVAFGEFSETIATPGTMYDLQVRVAGTETVALSFGDVGLDNNTNYTVFAKGLLADGSLGALVSVDDSMDGSTSLTLDPAMAMLRVAHLSPDAPNVDVWMDGTLISALVDVPFRAVSGYLEVSALTHNVQVFVTGTTMDPVIDATLTLHPNQSYTVAASGLAASGDLSPVVLLDDLMISDNGDAKVRFAHFSPDAPAVDIVVSGGPTLFQDVSFRQFNGYDAVGAGSYDLEVRLTDGGGLALSLPNTQLNTSTNYSVFAIGLAGDGSLDALLIQDTQ